MRESRPDWGGFWCMIFETFFSLRNSMSCTVFRTCLLNWKYSLYMFFFQIESTSCPSGRIIILSDFEWLDFFEILIFYFSEIDSLPIIWVVEKKIGNLRVNTDDNTVENYYSLTIWLFLLSRLADDLDILRTFESLVLCTSSAYLTKYFPLHYSESSDCM